MINKNEQKLEKDEQELDWTLPKPLPPVPKEAVDRSQNPKYLYVENSDICRKVFD